MLLLDTDISQGPMDYSTDLGHSIPLPQRGAVSLKHTQTACSQTCAFQRHIWVGRATGLWCGGVWIFPGFPFACSLLNDRSCHYLDFDLSQSCWFTKRPANCKNLEPWKEKEIHTEGGPEVISTPSILKYQPFGASLFFVFFLNL